MLAEARRQFLIEYAAVRHAEGRGAEDPAWYLALPFRDLTGALTGQWRIRAQSWQYLERRLLPALVRRIGRGLRVLDLGAGNCWMSWRLAQLGHLPIALDIFSDLRDGLRASRHYTAQIAFPVIEAEFDSIPLANGAADLAIFNASFHYSADYSRTLAEVLRVLQPGGAVVIMDSPVYQHPEHGLRMVAERRRQYWQRFGFASDAHKGVEFLDCATLADLARRFRLRWTAHRPWYGWRWHARPAIAWLKGKRPPSRFQLLVGERQ